MNEYECEEVGAQKLGLNNLKGAYYSSIAEELGLVRENSIEEQSADENCR